MVAPLLGIADGLVGGPGALEVGVKGGQLGAHAPGQSSQHPTDVAGLGLLARTFEAGATGFRGHGDWCESAESNKRGSCSLGWARGRAC